MCCKTRETNNNSTITNTLRNRAWASFGLVSCYRLLGQYFAKEGVWFEEIEKCSPAIYDKCLGSYREDLLDPLEDLSRKLALGVLIISVVLSVLAFKWRYLADYFLTMEAVLRIVTNFFPNRASYNNTPQIYCMFACGMIVLLHTNARSDLFTLSLMLVI